METPLSIPVAAARIGTAVSDITDTTNDSPAAGAVTNSSGQQFIRGQDLPLLAHTTIDRKHFKFPRGIKCFHAMEHVPAFLKGPGGLDHEVWRTNAELKNHFHRPNVGTQNQWTGRSTKFFSAYPACLILQGTTVEDRLILINVWCQLSEEEHKEFWVVYKNDFVRPTKSCERNVLFDPTNPRLIGALDDQELRDAAVVHTESNQVVETNKSQKRDKDGIPLTNSQMRDAYVRTTEGTVDRALKKLHSQTSVGEENQGSATAQYEPVLITFSDAVTPHKPGRPSAPHAKRPKPKFEIKARDKKAVTVLFSVIGTLALEAGAADGEAMLAAFQQSEELYLFFSQGESPPWPSDERNSTRQPTLLPIGESQDSYHQNIGILSTVSLESL
jgi:hypothetical protein